MKYYNFKAEDDMNCDVRLFADDNIYGQIEKSALKQLFAASKLPGSLGVVGLPDIHQGYGLPIGGVLVSDPERGVISPGAVGYDINCGVRLLTANIKPADLQGRRNELLAMLKNKIPAGLGSKSSFRFTGEEFRDIIAGGLPYLIEEQGFGYIEDLSLCEGRGRVKPADPDKVSSKAVKRGSSQLGTLGSGNHFIEIQQVKKIFTEQKAPCRYPELKPDQITVMIHTGSRGFGHQIARDYIDLAKKSGVKTPTRALASFAANSRRGKNYLQAMGCAANFAFAGRQLITHKLRNLLLQIFPGIELKLYYDICHNIARREDHKLGPCRRKVLVHRKGATHLPAGNIALIPGSMGTGSYIVRSTGSRATELSFASAAHGAGRKMGRREAKRTLSEREHRESLGKVNVVSASGDSLLDESPLAYKNIDQVIEALIKTDLARPLVELEPLVVLKG